MAARKRNRVASACESRKAGHLRSSMSRPSPVKRHRDSKSPRNSSEHANKRRAVRELAREIDVDRNLETMVSQDPKLNGNLVPTVALGSSARSPRSERRKKTCSESKPLFLKLVDTPSNRTLRTKNTGSEATPGLDRRRNPKMYRAPTIHEVGVKSKESLGCLNMLAPVFTDCKLNGATAPRVVLRRLDVEQLLETGVLPVGPRKDARRQSFPANRDLKSRIKSRVRLKEIGTRGSHDALKTATKNVRHKKADGQTFEPVPCHEEKWWSSYPLKQVAVRLTKLPL